MKYTKGSKTHTPTVQYRSANVPLTRKVELPLAEVLREETFLNIPLEEEAVHHFLAKAALVFVCA